MIVEIYNLDIHRKNSIYIKLQKKHKKALFSELSILFLYVVFLHTFCFTFYFAIIKSTKSNEVSDDLQRFVF